MKRAGRAVVPVLFAVASVAGCGAGAPPPSAPAPTAALATGTSLAGLNACGLLTPAQLIQLGQATKGQPEGTQCFYPAATPTGTQLSVWLVTGTTVTGDGPGDRTLTIGRHRAVETAQSMTSQCDINLIVGRNVVVVIGTGVDLGIGPACAVATDAARLVEAKLP
ncbi:MAG TPA: DUF3558 family protein [Pseudonocardiaceae bacterium]|jgi:hypothetical protein|nr:DUF3558 family protein [Pseudonocardiaceae bacterium]